MDVIREILQYLHYNPLSTREEIRVGVNFGESDATLKRLIAMAVKDGNIIVEGNEGHALSFVGLCSSFDAFVFRYLFCKESG
jgi:hypothetical protein